MWMPYPSPPPYRRSATTPPRGARAVYQSGIGCGGRAAGNKDGIGPGGDGTLGYPAATAELLEQSDLIPLARR